MSMQFPQITAQSGSSPDAVSHSSARLWSGVGLLRKRVVFFLLLLSLNCFPRFDFRTTDGWRPVTAADRVWVECEWERVAHVDFLTQQPLISSFLLFVPELWGPWVEELNVRLGYGEPMMVQEKVRKQPGAMSFHFRGYGCQGFDGDHFWFRVRHVATESALVRLNTCRTRGCFKERYRDNRIDWLLGGVDLLANCSGRTVIQQLHS